MRRRRLVFLIGLALAVQLVTAGLSWATAAADQHGGMCGGGGTSLLESEAFRNAMKAYGPIERGSGQVIEIPPGERLARGWDLQ